MGRQIKPLGYVERKMAPSVGFEPTTCPLGGDCAIQLCHEGEFLVMNQAGLNPLKMQSFVHSDSCQFKENDQAKTPSHVSINLVYHIEK